MVSPLCFQKAQSFCNYFLHVCSKELLSFAYFQLLTDNVSYSLGNAGKKKASSMMFFAEAGGLDNAPSSRIVVCLLLPGPMEADQWLHTVRANRHMWPLQMTSHAAANQLATDIFMRGERRRLQARYLGEDPTQLALDRGESMDQACYGPSLPSAI